MADFRPQAGLYPNEASLKNNNPAGISYFGDNSFTKHLTDQGIKWQPGTYRPSKEGARYVSFDTVEDGMKAYDALWSTKKYQSMKVQDALNRWGTGKIGANIDIGKTVSQLTPEERNQLQVAQLAKESPGFLKEMKKSGLLKESVKQKGLFERAFDFFVPSAEAASPEVNYSFNMNGNQDSYKPVSQASVTPTLKQPDFNDINSVKSFFNENGGFGVREESAAKEIEGKFGISKEEAFKTVAKARYNKLIRQDSSTEGRYSQMVNKFRSEGLNGGYEKPVTPEQEATSQTGLLGVEKPVSDQEVQNYKSQFAGMDNRAFIDMVNQDGAYMKIPEAQKRGLVEFMKENYAKAIKSGDQSVIDGYKTTTANIFNKLYENSVDAQRARSQVLGQGGGAEGVLATVVNLDDMVKSVPVVGEFFKTLERSQTGGENLIEGVQEGRVVKAVKGGIDLISNAAMALGGPASQAIKNTIAEGLDQLSSWEPTGKVLGAIVSAPESFFRAIGEKAGVSEKDMAYFVAAGRDAILQAAIPAAIGGVKGAKSGFAASPAATSTAKVGSAIKGGAAGAGVEGLKGVFNPFQGLESIKGNVKVTAKQEKIVADAAKRVQDEVKNMEKNFSPNERISKEDLVRAAAAKNKFGDLTDVKDLTQAEANVANAKQGVIEQFQKEAGNSPVPFDKTQLSEGITASVKKSLGGRNLDVTTSKLVDNMVNQIWDGLTDNNGKVVGTLSDVHAMTAKMYDTILGAGKDAGVLNVNSMKSYLAIKEALYGELAKVPGFSQYLDDYRNLSRVEDLVKLAGKKSMTDVGRKSLQESMPPSWAGILGGAGITGSWGIAGSVLAASLLNRIKQGGKSVVRLNSSINKVADAMKAAGPDGEAALKKALGIVDEAPLGSGVKPISDYTSAAEKAAMIRSRLAAIDKARVNEKFPSNEPGQTVGAQSAPSKAEMTQQFEAMRPKPMKEPGETVGFGPQPSKAEIEAILNPKFTPKAEVKAPVPKSAPAKKPVQSPKEVAKLKAEIAAENAKASAPAKKAQVKKPAAKPVTAPKKVPAAPKATKAPEKPKAATKAKETAKPMKITAKAAETIKNVAEKAISLSTKERLALVRSFDKIDLQRIAQVLNGTKSGFLADVLAELNSK